MTDAELIAAYENHLASGAVLKLHEALELNRLVVLAKAGMELRRAVRDVNAPTARLALAAYDAKVSP